MSETRAIMSFAARDWDIDLDMKVRRFVMARTRLFYVPILHHSSLKSISNQCPM
jgi:hypothetical protein